MRRRGERRFSRLTSSYIASLALIGLLALPASASALTDFTWNGPQGSSGPPPPPGTPGPNFNWSNGANWVGGSAPSGSVGTLSFPAPASACPSPPNPCFFPSTNDVSGVSANAISIDGRTDYNITGDSLTLGAGGINSKSPPGATGGPATFFLPLVLGASQSWSMDNSPLELEGGVTGQSAALQLGLNNRGALIILRSDVEVGAVGVTGGSAANTDGQSSANGTVSLNQSSLNGSDGNPVTVADAEVLVTALPGANPASSIGPLSMIGGFLQVGGGSVPAGSLVVNGGLTLDSGSVTMMSIDQAGATAGTDYSQISANGPVKLAGILGVSGGSGCTTLNLGDVVTLITTTGTLSGTFTGLPDGAEEQLQCPGHGSPFNVRINYTQQAVTATIVPPGIPPPVLGQSFDAQPVSGLVFVKLPDQSQNHAAELPAGDPLAQAALGKGVGFVPLTQARQLPAGSQVDARSGTIQLVAATAKQGKTETGTFAGGLFKLSQDRRGQNKGLTTLSMLEGTGSGAPSYASCRKRAADGATPASVSRRVLQTLHASAHGRFRTRGRYSAATVRGTVWTMTDRCDGTLTVVQRDTVAVTDFVRHVTVLVHAGHSYLARAR